MHYPDDPALTFNSTPPMRGYTAKTNDPTSDALQKLQLVQQASWTTYQTAMFLTRQLNAGSKKCGAFLVVVLGQSDPAYNICMGWAWLASLLLMIAELAALLAWDGTSNAMVALTQDQTNWAKETYHFLTQHVFGDDDATSDPWLPKSLDIINTNIYNQHTQVRNELQSRHTQMVNDINQETVDVANCMGCQINQMLGGSCDPTDPAECPTDSRRRLEHKLSSMSWPADDDFEGGDNPWEVLKTLHDGMARIHKVLEIDDVDVPVLAPAPTPAKRSKKAKQAKLDDISTNLFSTETESEASGTVLGEGATRRRMTGEDTFRVELGKMNARMVAIEGKIEGRMDIVESRIGVVESKMDEIDGKVGAIERKVDALMDLVVQLMETKQS